MISLTKQTKYVVFICFDEGARKQTIVKVEIKSNSLNFNDLAVSEAILKQVSFGHVTLIAT